MAACLPTTLFAQQTEEQKAVVTWHLTIPEVTVIGHRPMKEIGVQKTKFDSLALKENIALSMADMLTFNSCVFVKSYGRATPLDRRVPRNVGFAYASDMERHAHQQPDAGHDRLLHHFRPTS